MINALIDHGKFANTNARPRLIQADDNQYYVVKFPPGDYVRSLFNEFLGGKLAKHFGLTVLDPTLIHLDNDFIENSKEIKEMNVVPGPYFATLKHDNCYNAGEQIAKNMNSKKIVNLEEVADFITFDIFLCNNDRNDANSILIATSEARTKFKYFLIDHGFCFNGPDWNISKIQPMPYKLACMPWKKDGITSESQFKKAVEKMTLTESEIDSLLTLLPPEWCLGTNETDNLKQTLSNRDQDKIMDILNTNKGKFEKWS